MGGYLALRRGWRTANGKRQVGEESGTPHHWRLSRYPTAFHPLSNPTWPGARVKPDIQRTVTPEPLGALVSVSA